MAETADQTNAFELQHPQRKKGSSRSSGRRRAADVHPVADPAPVRFKTDSVDGPEYVESGGVRFTTDHNEGRIAESTGVPSRKVSAAGREHNPRKISVNSIEGAKKFMRMDSIDRLPRLDFYRNRMSFGLAGLALNRPTLTDLHGAGDDAPVAPTPVSKGRFIVTLVVTGGGLQVMPPPDVEAGSLGSLEEPSTNTIKFGWIRGVLIRCFLSILGVMLYLRITWVAGQAGVGLATVILLISSLITALTTISMSAICTNGEVKGGGMYFMISRSLGPEFGGSIGIIFSFADASNTAMQIVGFAETVRDIIKGSGVTFLDDTNSVRVIGFLTAILVLVVTQVGMEWEARSQLLFLVVLLASAVDYWVGTFIAPSRGSSRYERGFHGYSGSILAANFGPAFRPFGGEMQDFFTVFGVYFPAVTSIFAGANISGDLKEPQKAVPVGTLLAILLTTIFYASVVWMSGSGVIRDAVIPSAKFYFNGTVVGGMNEYWSTMNDSDKVSIARTIIINMTSAERADYCMAHSDQCGGLMNDMQVCNLQAGWDILITAGIFAATLSSAFSALVSCAKVFEAVCQDNIFPLIHVFARTYGKNKDPRLSYLLMFIIAEGIIMVGSLNDIALIITNFYLATYALINYAVFDASFANSPGFRPGFKYYNKWVSLLTAVACVAVMFIIKWWAALVTFAAIAIIYVYVSRRKLDINWGSSGQAHMYRSALRSLLKLQQREEHVKNYRPQILLLTGNPTARPSLIDFASSITTTRSMLLCGHVIVKAKDSKTRVNISQLRSDVTDWLTSRKTKAFYHPYETEATFRDGVRVLMQNTGLSRLRPNTVVFGFKNDWETCPHQEMLEYFTMVHDAFDANLAVAVLRGTTGFDVGQVVDEHHVLTRSALEISGKSVSVPNMQDLIKTPSSPGPYPFTESDQNLHSTGIGKIDNEIANNGMQSKRIRFASSGDNLNEERKENPKLKKTLTFNSLSGPLAFFRGLTKQQKLSLASVEQFKRHVKNAVIDVWWLFDDGGLTLLIPHLLMLRKSYLSGAKLRVFTMAASNDTVETEKENMIAMLAKFRIMCDEVFVIPDLGKKPDESSVKEYEEIVNRHRLPLDADASVNKEYYITDEELSKNKAKSYRHIRIRELLMEHSSNANLIIVTLTVPRKGGCSAPLYMTWLSLLTRDLPPVLLVRGNQQSVLTFYS